MIITLTTDFGLSDPYVAAMKGVILSIQPDAVIVDVSHDVPPQDTDRAAFVIKGAYPFFPKGSIHVVVVDPGVGTERLILVVKTRDFLFLAPNNGVLKYVFEADPEAKVFCAARPEYFRETVSRTFHGRDIFAPLAGHLAKGVPPEKLGRPFEDYERGTVAAAARLEDRIVGEVIAFDRYGNAITNIPAEWLADADRVRVVVKGLVLENLSRSYLDVPAGELLAILGGADALELSVNHGSARDNLELSLGETVIAVLG
ncbi:MAG: SAM-dependent chlorinase/fluorinase [bacterium]|nr:SAM-dependent chlorinase/fluorinase [bacterium]